MFARVKSLFLTTFEGVVMFIYDFDSYRMHRVDNDNVHVYKGSDMIARIEKRSAIVLLYYFDYLHFDARQILRMLENQGYRGARAVHVR